MTPITHFGLDGKADRSIPAVAVAKDRDEHLRSRCRSRLESLGFQKRMTDAVFDGVSKIVKLELFVEQAVLYALGMMSCGWKSAGRQPLKGVRC